MIQKNNNSCLFIGNSDSLGRKTGLGIQNGKKGVNLVPYLVQIKSKTWEYLSIVMEISIKKNI